MALRLVGLTRLPVWLQHVLIALAIGLGAAMVCVVAGIS